jgi:putative DNA methylase
VTDPASPDNRKMIEVALPLTEISAASRADKDRRTGSIRNLHKWFAPMPLPALRALIFSALVDDPGTDDGREALLKVIVDLVPPDGGAPDQAALRGAATHIRRCNPDLPIVLDPFSGTGTTLIEALRLGLPAVGADLNPVPAMITRTLTQLLPALTGRPGLHEGDGLLDRPLGGLEADLLHYGNLVGEAVRKRLGWAYPQIPGETVVAWLWARTAPCGNPACHLRFPLFGSPWLSKQRGRQAAARVEVVDDEVRIVLERGPAATRAESTKAPGRASFRCPRCAEVLNEKDMRQLGHAGALGLTLLAVCVDTCNGREFRSPYEVELPPEVAEIEDLDDLEIGANTKNFSTPLYGLPYQSDLYTSRQRAMLAAFADEVAALPDVVRADGGDEAQVLAITSVLGMAVSRLAQASSSLTRWLTRDGSPKAEPAFGTQAMPMLWDFAECNPFGGSVGSWTGQVKSAIIATRHVPSGLPARVVQEDARRAGALVPPGSALVVTDPPYFAQIQYADLSDYFYLWLRRALRGVHTDLFSTLATPKTPELVANAMRHGGSKETARRYFIDGFTEVFSSLRRASRPDLPLVVVYAHKQDEETVDGILSSGWESLLAALLAAGLSVVGTWPVEAARNSRQIEVGTNALASYVVLVCRSRSDTADTIDRRRFLAALRAELPVRIAELRQVDIAPVDLAQAALGPGMAVFSRYRQVTEPDGTPMRVRQALIEINRVLADVLHQHEGDFDSDTRWCVQWFTEFGWERNTYGRAEQLANAYDTSVDGMERAGVLRKIGGDVWLIAPSDLPSIYDPITDLRPTVWEGTWHLARKLAVEGIGPAGALMARLTVDIDAVKDLAYLLYNICERKRRIENALLLNSLVTSWADITVASRQQPAVDSQPSLDL